MKKQLLVLLIVIPLLSGCDLLGELTKFSLPFSETISIPQTPVAVVDVNITTPDITTGIDSVLDSLKIDAELIESVSLKSMQFTIKTPATSDLSFFDDVDIFISSAGKTDIKIASAVNIANVSTIDFTTEPTDLKDFVLGEKFALKLVGKTDEIVTQASEVEVKFIFDVKLKMMGI